MGGAGEEERDLNVQLFLSEGSVIGFLNLRRWEGQAEMKEIGEFGPKVFISLYGKESWKIADTNM